MASLVSFFFTFFGFFGLPRHGLHTAHPLSHSPRFLLPLAHISSCLLSVSFFPLLPLSLLFPSCLPYLALSLLSLRLGSPLFSLLELPAFSSLWVLTLLLGSSGLANIKQKAVAVTGAHGGSATRPNAAAGHYVYTTRGVINQRDIVDTVYNAAAYLITRLSHTYHRRISYSVWRTPASFIMRMPVASVHHFEEEAH